MHFYCVTHGAHFLNSVTLQVTEDRQTLPHGMRQLPSAPAARCHIENATWDVVSGRQPS